MFVFIISVFVFVILKGKIINLKSKICVCDFCVCVCDFGLENNKLKFLFLILGWAGHDRTGPDKVGLG